MGQIVKVFGERNTGTRAMQALLRQVPGVTHRVAARPDPPSYEPEVYAAVESELRGHWKRLYLHAMRDDLATRHAGNDPWKHARPVLAPAMQAAGVATIHMVRDPYSWLIGLARRPYHLKGPQAETLEAFAARPWMTEAREGMAAVVASPLCLWADKMAAVLAYYDVARTAELPCEIICFEDFVQNPGAVAGAAFARLGLPATDLRAREENTKAGEASADVLRRYYAEERWATWLTRDAVARVNARIDWAVAAEFGYKRRDPADFPEHRSSEVEAQMRAEMASLRTPSHREACAAPTA